MFKKWKEIKTTYDKMTNWWDVTRLSEDARNARVDHLSGYQDRLRERIEELEKRFVEFYKLHQQFINNFTGAADRGKNFHDLMRAQSELIDKMFSLGQSERSALFKRVADLESIVSSRVED